MKITFYKDLLAQRINQLDFLPEADRTATIEQLPALEAITQTLEVDPSAVKPYKRPKGQAELSLLMNGGVPSVKVAHLGHKASSHRVYLRVDALPDSPENTVPHYYVTKVYPVILYPDTSEANLEKNRVAMEGITYEIIMLKITGQYLRHGIREIGTMKDPLTGETLTLQKIYLDSKFVHGVTLSDCQKSLRHLAKTQNKWLHMPQLLRFMLKLVVTVRQFHESGWTHGDLHARNIMIHGDIFGEFELSIIDFDRARPFGKTCTIKPVEIPTAKKPCPLRQFPPECCGKSVVEFTTAADIYAIGEIIDRFQEISLLVPPERDFAQGILRDMRCPEPTLRPGLDIIQNEISTKMIKKENYYYSRLTIMIEGKLEVIAALQEFEQQGSQSYWCVRYADPLYQQKIAHFRDLITKLKETHLRKNFHATLREGYLSYVRRFIAPHLKDYRESLGLATECFVKAISVFWGVIDEDELLDDVKLHLPLNDPLSLVYRQNLSNVLHRPCQSPVPVQNTNSFFIRY